MRRALLAVALLAGCTTRLHQYSGAYECPYGYVQVGDDACADPQVLTVIAGILGLVFWIWFIATVRDTNQRVRRIEEKLSKRD